MFRTPPIGELGVESELACSSPPAGSTCPINETRYRLAVTAEPAHEHAPPPASAASPRGIRAALLPEEAGQFDSEWRVAMSRAAESLDLTEVYRALERWQLIAEMTRANPDAHRHMLRRAAQILAGEHVGSITADDQRAMIARRLGERR